MTTTTGRPRTRSQIGDKPAYTTADLDLHARACLQPTAGTAWSDSCTCRHVRGRHNAARHQPIPTTSPTGTAMCTGRNLAGPCLWPVCPCTAFAPATGNQPRRGQP